ncbi:MAG: DUF4372 domain-containing protein [Syntrophaceae bacterium]|nr:DUF4372 domain-containing protein [Syntrophaceae bacterium]
MNRFSSIFGQILHLFPRREFFEAVEATRADRGAKGFDCWEQFVAMLFCQLGQAHSLREICGGWPVVSARPGIWAFRRPRNARPWPTPMSTAPGSSTRSCFISSWGVASNCSSASGRSGSRTGSSASMPRSSLCASLCLTGPSTGGPRGP